MISLLLILPVLVLYMNGLTQYSLGCVSSVNIEITEHWQAEDVFIDLLVLLGPKCREVVDYK